jgi:hypothetical protein
MAQKMDSISEVTEAVALGELGKLVNLDVQGQMLDLKMTLNSMVVHLSTLENDACEPLGRDRGNSGRAPRCRRCGRSVLVTYLCGF